MHLIWFSFWKAKQLDQYGRRKCPIQGCISVGICGARLRGLSLARNLWVWPYNMWLVFLEMQSSGCSKAAGWPACFSELCGSMFSFLFVAVFCLPCWWASQQLSWIAPHLLPGLLPGGSSILFQKLILVYPFGVKRGWCAGPLSYTSVCFFWIISCTSTVLALVSAKEFPCLQSLAPWSHLAHSVSSLGHAANLESLFLPVYEAS